MSYTLTADLRSLILEVDWPLEDDGVTPRDDIVGMKVWMSTTDGFTPGPSNLAYDGADLKVRSDGLTAGSVYYLRYALISAIDPSDWVVSDQISGTPIRVTTANQSTFIESLTADAIKAGILSGRTFLTKGSYLTAACSEGPATLQVYDTSDFPASGVALILDPASGGSDDQLVYDSKTATTLTSTGQAAHAAGCVIIPKVPCIVVDSVTNRVSFYGDDGTGNIARVASIGISEADSVIARFGASGSSSSRTAIQAFSYSASAVDAYSPSGVAINAITSNGTAIVCGGGSGTPLEIIDAGALPTDSRSGAGVLNAGALAFRAMVLRLFTDTGWRSLQMRGTQYFSEPEAANQDSISFNDTTNTFSLNADGGSGNGNLVVGEVSGTKSSFTELSFSTAITLTDLDLNNATSKSGLHALDSTSTYTNLPPGFASPGRAYVDILGSGAYGAQMMHQMSDALPAQKIAYRRWRGASWGTWAMLVQQGDDLAVASLLSTGSIGYGTGAGGTVTQATSKSTAVTLNKVSGKVTMHNAALAAGAAVAFTFNNSTLAATDTLTLNLLDTSIGSPLSYRIWASVKAGVAIVCVENRSAGSLSEAVAINFNVQKGVTS